MNVTSKSPSSVTTHTWGDDGRNIFPTNVGRGSSRGGVCSGQSTKQMFTTSVSITQNGLRKICSGIIFFFFFLAVFFIICTKITTLRGSALLPLGQIYMVDTAVCLSKPFFPSSLLTQ